MLDTRPLESRAMKKSPSFRAATPGRPRRSDKVAVPDYSEGLQIKTEDPDPRFNNALARGLAMLRAFQLDRTLLGNLELAQITGLSQPDGVAPVAHAHAAGLPALPRGVRQVRTRGRRGRPGVPLPRQPGGAADRASADGGAGAQDHDQHRPGRAGRAERVLPGIRARRNQPQPAAARWAFACRWRAPRWAVPASPACGPSSANASTSTCAPTTRASGRRCARNSTTRCRRCR